MKYLLLMLAVIALLATSGCIWFPGGGDRGGGYRGHPGGGDRDEHSSGGNHGGDHDDHH